MSNAQGQGQFVIVPDFLPRRRAGIDISTTSYLSTDGFTCAAGAAGDLSVLGYGHTPQALRAYEGRGAINLFPHVRLPGWCDYLPQDGDEPSLLYIFDRETNRVEVFQEGSPSALLNGYRKDLSFQIDTVNNTDPRGLIVRRDVDRVYIPDASKLYAYARTNPGPGSRASADVTDDDFNFAAAHRNTAGGTFADAHFYFPDSTDHEVYAYAPDGTRVNAREWSPEAANANEVDIAYFGDAFHILDSVDKKSYAYALDGTYVRASDVSFADSFTPRGITEGSDAILLADEGDYQTITGLAAGDRVQAAGRDLFLLAVRAVAGSPSTAGTIEVALP